MALPSGTDDPAGDEDVVEGVLMIKKVLAITGATVLVSALGLYAVGAVFAQEPTTTPETTPAPETAPPAGGPWGHICRGADVLSDAVLQLLGMTRDEVLTERQAGKTLSQIAGEKGVSDQQVIDAMLAEQQAALDQAVKDGKITQEQADWLAARSEALAPFELSNPFTPPAGHEGPPAAGEGRHRGHGCWGEHAPESTPESTPESSS